MRIRAHLSRSLPSVRALTQTMTPPGHHFLAGPATDTAGGNGLALPLSQTLVHITSAHLPPPRAAKLLRNSPARFGLTKTSRARWPSPEVFVKGRLPGRRDRVTTPVFDCIIPRASVSCLLRFSPSACCHIAANSVPRSLPSFSSAPLVSEVGGGLLRLRRFDCDVLFRGSRCAVSASLVCGILCQWRGSLGTLCEGQGKSTHPELGFVKSVRIV